MPLTFSRSAKVVVFAAVIGLVCLPACKKKPKPPDASPSPGPATGGPPGPGGPGGNTVVRDPMAPRSPVFAEGVLGATMRAGSEGNMKQIMLALHSAHDATGAFPGGYADKTGKPGLSWRVAILPYLEQTALFQKFKLDEPWDSPTNKGLISQMPPVYAPPRTDTRGYTFYRGFTGPNTWLPQQQSNQPGQLIRGAKMTDFTDGLSNTIVVAEAYEPVIWTKPDEMVFAPNNVPRLGGVFSTGTVVGFGDGSTRFLRPTLSQKTLANAIQINDGNIVQIDD